MDGDDAETARNDDGSRPHSAPGGLAPQTMAPNGSLDNGASNATFGDVLGALQPEMYAPFTKLPVAPFAAPAAGEDPALSDSAFAASMASFTSDLHAELARLSAAPVASLYFDQPTASTTTTTTTTTPPTRHAPCAGCSAALDESYPEAYAATGATFCLCCERPLLLPGMDYVQEEDAAFPRCAPCLLARLPAKPVVDEPWWPVQYKHALLRAVETKLWRKLLEVGNLPQGGASARHQLYHRRNQLENAQRVHERKTLEAARSGSDHSALVREWRELLVREDAENFRLIVLLSKCLQEIGRGVPPEVGEALQLCRGRDLRGEHDAARRVASVLTPVSCGCCPAVLSIPAPSGVPLPNPCFCFCCARMVPESLMYQPENASKPTNGDLCLDCAAAHDDLERKWFLVSASPTMMDWKRHKVAMGLERQLKRVRDSTAAAYKAGCESEKDRARWRVADDAAAQWQSRSEKILSDQRGVLRRGWTPAADSRQSYSIQAEYEAKFVVAIPPLLKVLANLLVRQRIAVGSDDVRTTLKRSESMDEPRSEGRDIKVRKF